MIVPSSLWTSAAAVVGRRFIPLVFEQQHLIHTAPNSRFSLSLTSTRVLGVKLHRNQLSSSSRVWPKKTGNSSTKYPYEQAAPRPADYGGKATDRCSRGINRATTKPLGAGNAPLTTLNGSLVRDEQQTGPAGFSPTSVTEPEHESKMQDGKKSGSSTTEESGADNRPQKEEHDLPAQSEEMEKNPQPSTCPPYMYPADPCLQPEQPPEPPQKRRAN
uniref:Uncharacterized protein n=1 Tax=Neospora caninum (strain Liverpool) TaxID=572307 RepID=A0A0F7U4U0_NEOCL|nr:TPA: hypothetical protein BN1204_006593 [Neospora caninum Liverpool]